eukprot:gene9455-11199_t
MSTVANISLTTVAMNILVNILVNTVGRADLKEKVEDKDTLARGGERTGAVGAAQEKLRQDPDTQDVIKKLYNTDIVVVKQTGEVTLDSGGYRTTQTRMSMNDALNAIGMKLVHNEADPSEWTVSDGKFFLKRYEDGMVIPAGQAGRGRGLALLKASGDPSATAAVQATEASDAAALAAGIVP